MVEPLASQLASQKHEILSAFLFAHTNKRFFKVVCTTNGFGLNSESWALSPDSTPTMLILYYTWLYLSANSWKIILIYLQGPFYSFYFKIPFLIQCNTLHCFFVFVKFTSSFRVKIRLLFFFSQCINCFFFFLCTMCG